MQKVIAALAALVAAGVALGLTAPSWAVSELREDGTGFVTGTDVRAALGWSDGTLRAGAAALEFVAETESATVLSWQCASAETSEVVDRRTRLVVTETRALASVPRLLPWGAVAGFRLEGFAGPGASSAVPEGPAPHSCPAGPWTVVAGSAQRTEEPGGPVLKVVHDGVQHDLLVPGAGTPS